MTNYGMIGEPLFFNLVKNILNIIEAILKLHHTAYLFPGLCNHSFILLRYY